MQKHLEVLNGVMEETISSQKVIKAFRRDESVIETFHLNERTSFVIAHRLRTIRDADQVLVINDGKIIKKKTHRELMDRQVFYHNL